MYGGNVYIYNPGHITRMAAMPICGNSGTAGPLSTKLNGL